MISRTIYRTLLGFLAATSLAAPVPARAAARETGAGPQGGPSSLAIDPTDGSLLKADGGLARSTDQGRSWRRLTIPANLRPEALRQVTTTAAAPSRVYAAGPGTGVIRSDDRGNTWRAIGTGLPVQQASALAAHSFRPDTLYVWTKGDGVFRTQDGGTSWLRMDQGPPAPVASLAHSTLEGSMNTGWLYAATPAGPFISMDCF